MALKGKHGAMLAGRYRLLEQLGEGGMGSVWKAEHLVLHSHVAIKIIDPDVARFEFNLARFLREAKTLASLRSPNVVQVLDFGSDADTPYLVMELLEGQTLGRRLTKKGRLSLAETSHVLADVCTAMSVVHEQGLIHRDLKPDNIFLCEAVEQRITKIVDFGIAKSLRPDVSSMKTRTGHMLGTPSYMSPEQCRGLKDIDHRADLWALGVIAYECLVGKVPFEGEVLGDLLLRICMDPLPIPSREARGDLPDEFDAWFAKAVARDREARFQSASELAASLAALGPTAVGASSGSAVGGRERPPWSQPRVSPPLGSAPRRAPVASAPGSSAPRWSASSPSGPAASPLPLASPRRPTDTETNTAVGLGSLAAFKGRRRTRALAVGAVAVAAVLGLGAVVTKPAADAGADVRVQSLRPPFEVTPKVIRAAVPSGRRWQPTANPEPHMPSGSGSAQPERSSPPSAGAESHAPSDAPLLVPGAFTSVAPGESSPSARLGGPVEVGGAAGVDGTPSLAGAAGAPSAGAPAPRALRGTAAPAASDRASSSGDDRPER